MARALLRGLVALLVGLLLAAQVVAAGPASAHGVLVATTPGEGAPVDASPAAVTLTFDAPVSTRFSTVRVTGPEGGTWSTGPADVSGDTVSQPVGELGPAGAYAVDWRTVSADGHPISGTFAFTLTTAGTGSPVPQGDAEPADDGTSLVLPLAGALLVAGAVLVAVRRSRAARLARR